MRRKMGIGIAWMLFVINCVVNRWVGVFIKNNR
jgi:hypothetical protein